MSWCALDVRAPEDQRSAVAAWLVEKTGQAVEERDDGSLIGVTISEALGSVLSELRGAFGSRVTALSRSLPEQDWSSSWRQGLGPRQIGRLFVTPSWTASPLPEPFQVVIDPETAFGTGEHGSTRTALLLLDRLMQPGDRVLDLGSGSGILSIAAVKLGAARAVGIDVDPEVEPVARLNAQRNAVDSKAAFVTGDAALLAPLLGPADLVLSNILRSHNEELLPVVARTLAPEGRAIFAGMEERESELFRSVLSHSGFGLLDQAVDEGWWGVAVCSR